jgi:hypothetical protein
MKIALIITAYKNPKHIDRMISILSHPDFYFFIHLDKKIDVEPFSFLSTRQNVVLVKKRSKVGWATFSIAEAAINSLLEAKSSGNFDRYVLMSGQDFPLMTPNEFLDFLNSDTEAEYINAIPYDLNHEWWKVNAVRVDKFSLLNWDFKGNTRLTQLLNWITPQRRHPKNIIIAGNSNWFCLTSKCIDHMLTQFQKNKAIARFFKLVWGSDEFLFSTLAFNSPYRDHIKPNLTFVEWSGWGEGHPNILGVGHFDKLIQSGKFLARKFDSDYDNEILIMLESLLHEKIKMEDNQKK